MRHLTNSLDQYIIHFDSKRGDYMSYPRLNKYTVYMKLTVWGESPEDALDYANTALDASDLLTQDGIIGLELDEDSIYPAEEDDDDTENHDEDY